MPWTTPRTWTDGELVTKAIMDPHIRDNLNMIGNHYRIRKTADESVTSSAVVQADNELLFPIAASETWQFEVLAGITFAATPGMRWTFTAPSGASGSWYSMPHGNFSAVEFGTAFATELTTSGSATTTDPWQLGGMAVNGATPGNVTFAWGQSVSNASATTVLANSWLIAHKIG